MEEVEVSSSRVFLRIDYWWKGRMRDFLLWNNSLDCSSYELENFHVDHILGPSWPLLVFKNVVLGTFPLVVKVDLSFVE